MSDQERLVVLLEAKVSDFEKRMRKAENTGTDSYRRMRTGSRSATKQMEKDMTSATQKINQALSSTSSKIGSFAASFAGGLVGGAIATAFAGITSNVLGTVKGIAQLGDEAKRAGVGLQGFQEWKFVADQNRVSMDALVDGFKELNLRADEFVITGKGSAAEAFARLGYTAADLKTKLKDPSALMLEIMGRLEGLDKAAQIRIADELFGGTGGEQFVQLLDQGRAGIEKTIAKGRELGAVMDDEVIAKAAEIDRKFNELTTAAGNWVKATIVGLVAAGVEMADFREKLEDLFENEAEGRSILGDGVFDALEGDRDAIDAVAEDVRNLKGEFDSLSIGAIDTANRMSDFAGELERMGLNEQAGIIREYADGLRKASEEYAQGSLSADEFAGKITEVQSSAEEAFGSLANVDGVSFNGAIAELGKLGAMIQSVTGWAKTLRANMPGGSLGMTTGAPLSGDVEDLLPPSLYAPTSSKRPQRQDVDSYGNWLEANEPKKGGKKGGGKADKDEYASTVSGLKEKIGLLNMEATALVAAAGSGKQYGDAIEYAKTRAQLFHAAQQQGKEITPALTAEIDALAQSYVTAGKNAEEAEERMKKIAEASERGADAMSDVFMSVLDGSKSAKQAVADLLMEMAKVQMQKAFLGLASGSGGGFLGTIGSLFGGFRAEGGPVSSGKGYIVGEKGPEWFQPGTSGSIVPNHELGSGAAPNITIHLDARGSVEGEAQRFAQYFRQAAPSLISAAVSKVRDDASRGRR